MSRCGFSLRSGRAGALGSGSGGGAHARNDSFNERRNTLFRNTPSPRPRDPVWKPESRGSVLASPLLPPLELHGSLKVGGGACVVVTHSGEISPLAARHPRCWVRARVFLLVFFFLLLLLLLQTRTPFLRVLGLPRPDKFQSENELHSKKHLPCPPRPPEY